MPKTKKLIPIVAIIMVLLMATGASGISCGCCQCLTWDPVTVTWDGSPPETWTGDCEGIMPISWIGGGTPVSISSSIGCTTTGPSCTPGGCSPVYSWSVTKIPGSGTPEGPWNGNGLPASFSPEYPGCFKVALKATCHDGISKVCSPCETTICICDIEGCPGLCGCDITDMAVDGDGNTIYVICDNNVYKSIDGGCNFAACVLPSGFVTPPRAIAAAPDDPNTVAIVDSSTPRHVFISNNACFTWADLGDPTGGDASEVISDIAVSPAVAASMLGRDVLVSTYDTDNCQAGWGNWGDIYMMGPTSTWASQAQGAGANYDWTSIALSPSWVGQRAVVGVGSDSFAAGNAEVGATGWAGDTYLVAFNVNPIVGPLIIAPTPVNMDTGTYDSPCEITLGALNGEIVSSSIALPADFDSATVAQFQSYLGWTSIGTLNGDDVYRVDFNIARRLNILGGTNIGIWSIAYGGTIADGRLIAGEEADNKVWYTTTPTSAVPDWGSSLLPLGVWRTVVAINPTDSNICYAGTSGSGSCFLISTDGAHSFHLP
jgi:hypothetical protein